MADLEPVIFSGITVIPLIHDPVILNGITRSHSAGLAGHFERDYATKAGTGTNCGSSYNYTVPGGYPASWSFRDKKGTIGYFMEGHDLETMKYMTQPVWDRFFKQFMYYMAGYDSVKVASALGKEGDVISEAFDSELQVDPSGITFHPSDQAGVLISAPGRHKVSVYDINGNLLRKIEGAQGPVDYDLGSELHGLRSGVYLMRVSASNGIKSKRIFVP